MLRKISCQMELGMGFLKVTQMKLMLHCPDVNAILASSMFRNAAELKEREVKGTGWPHHLLLKQS